MDGGFATIRLQLLGYRIPASLFAFPHSLSSLKTLDVLNNGLCRDAVRSLGAFTALTRLTLGLGAVQDGKFLCWKGLIHMKSLSLHFYGGQCPSGRCISQVLAAMKDLDALHLCGLKGDAAIMFTEGLQKQQLTLLELEKSELRNVFEGVGSALRRVSSSLKSLHLVSLGIEETKLAMALVHVLPECTRLEQLQLRFSHPKNKTICSQLAETISKVVTLCELDMEMTDFPLDTCKQPPSVPAWSMIARLPYLRSLTICVPLGWTADALIEVCRKCKMLNHVRIIDADGRISGPCLEALAGLPRLKRLNLEDTSDVNVKDLLVLRSGKGLMEIRAMGCSGNILQHAVVAKVLKASLPALMLCNMCP